MKPHNIQILSLLSMFGCGTAVSKSLKSQAMQIRTGEGKSMILGAAAAIFGLLGFRVNCVCYSKDLSTRDYERFHDVFDHFGLSHVIKYSTIDTLILSQMKKKGDIFSLTHSLLHGTLKQHGIRRCTRKSKEEILLVDEVDVFFGSEFYGSKYFNTLLVIYIRRILYPCRSLNHYDLRFLSYFNRNVEPSSIFERTGSVYDINTYLGFIQ